MSLKEESTELTAQFKLELDELEKLQATRRKEAADQAAAESAKAVAAAASAEAEARSANDKLSLMLTEQADQETKRGERRQLWVRSIGFVLGIGLPTGGYGGYRWVQAPAAASSEDVQATVETRTAAVEVRQQAYGARIEILKDLHFESLKVILAGQDEAAAERALILKRLKVTVLNAEEREEAEVQVIKDAREAVRDYTELKKKAREKSLTKTGDPFAGLPVPAPVAPSP